MRNKKLTEEQKDKWLSVITNEFKSSKESGPNDEIYVLYHGGVTCHKDVCYN